MRERRAEILKVHNADMKWFKFYGQDFQTDPKIGYLTTPQKLMWVNLLCIASQDENHSGIIKFLTESHLRSVSGILDSPSNDDWDQSQNTFETFEKLGLIERPDEDTIIITTAKGIVIRTTLNNIRVMGRATQGVRIVKLAEGDKVTDLIRVLDAETDIPQTPEKNPTLE